MTAIEQKLSAITQDCMDIIDKAQALHPACGVVGVIGSSVQQAFDYGFACARAIQREPTPEMVKAGEDASPIADDWARVREVWIAMYDAAAPSTGWRYVFT